MAMKADKFSPAGKTGAVGPRLIANRLEKVQKAPGRASKGQWGT